MEHSDSDNDEVAEVSNLKVFESPQTHYTCGDFLCTFGDGGIYDVCKLEVVENFSEGAQAELPHACVRPVLRSNDMEVCGRWRYLVLKGVVFDRFPKVVARGNFHHYEVWERRSAHCLGSLYLWSGILTYCVGYQSIIPVERF